MKYYISTILGKLTHSAVAAIFFVSLISVAAPSPVAAAEPQYPLLSLYYVDCCFTMSEAADIAKFDLVIVTMEAAEYNAVGIAKLRELNPKIKIIPYVPSQGIVEQYPSATRERLINVVRPDWYLIRPNGEKVSRYTGEYDLNITKPEVRTAISDFVADLNDDTCGTKRCWDGVFFDVVEDNLDFLGQLDLNRDGLADSNVNTQWVAAYKDLFKTTRNKIGTDSLIIINGASNLDIQSDINGRMFENFPTPWHANGKWDGTAENVPTLNQYNMNPVGIIFSGEGAKTDYKKMRFSIVSGLISGTYAGYDNGVDKHNSIWLYDEYNVQLGKAQGKAKNLSNKKDPYKIQDGMWQRNFENGTVLLNTTDQQQTITLDQGYEKIRGDQDESVNTGETIGTVTVNPHDGVILRARLQQVEDAEYFNGAFTNIYNNAGERTRTSFFAFSRKYAGGTIVRHISDVGRTVVADKTYVTVYKGTKQVAKFAPFGKGYAGGVHIAVDRLSDPDATGKNKGVLKPYRIVVAPKSGNPQIKIYDLKGGVVQNNCTVFSSKSTSGVNIAIGDVLPSKAGKEIVVAPGSSGTPQVKVYSAKCKILNGGFTAYDTGVKSGVSVAVGDLDGKGQDEIVTMPAAKAQSFVRVFRIEKGKKKVVNKGFYAFPKSNKAGGFVTISDLDTDGKNEIVPMSYGIFNF